MIEAPCPSREALLRYLQGNFDASEIDSFEEHLDRCPSCEETVAELEDTNDTLMRHLPLAAVGQVKADADGPVWIERLKAGPPTKLDEQSGQRAQRKVDGPGAPLAHDWADGLASYELLEVLGRGGMGVVYRGRHRQLRRAVAVKVMRPKLVSAAEAHRRFDREIQILGGLNHPGIVMATDAGRVGPTTYLVMELIDGVDLARLVRSAGPLDVGEACEVARQIAAALSAAHATGAVHRDVKPSNVMIDSAGRVKLLDFGLASLLELSDDHGETSLGRLIGTLDYMAPEQAEGIRVQASADLYGLGATLFYLLAGRPPHARDQNRTLLGQLKALSCEDPPRLADLRLDVPQELSDLVAKLLARHPADRPENAALVADRLAAWAEPDAQVALAAMIPAVDRSDDAESAARSLVELVGGEPGKPRSKPASKGQTLANGRGRRIGGWLLGLAGFAAAALGIVLLIDTPEGTLRIESEAENVQVELIDEADRTQTVQIEEGENATPLRAGKYRIRLAGKHDNLSLTPDAIELRRGEERLARITHLPPGVAETQLAGRGATSGEPGTRATNEELTPVKISVEYEDGRPATGAEVTLRMQGGGMQGPDRPVVVTGIADAEGVAFNRNLPYGKYEMTIKVAEGDTAYWSATLQDILLEFGGSYKQKVLAPTPKKPATVKVQTAFRPAGLKGLRFGNFVGREGFRGYGIVFSPEPGQQDEQFADTPVLENGISNAAIMLKMSVTRNVKQRGSKTLDWLWNRQGNYGYWSDFLLLTDKSVIELTDDWGGNVSDELPENSEYFSNMRQWNGVQYFTFSGRQRAANPLSLEFPPGKLECDVRTVFGKANDEVIQALGLEPQAGREIWLEAKLNAESAWVPRAIDLSEWNRGKGINDLVYKTLSLEPGETHEIRVASPDATELRRDDEQSAGVITPPDVLETQLAGRGATLGEPRVREINEELTPVTISVEYEDGRPATGAEVRLSMEGNPARPVVVTGKADTDGVALNRNLPYGKYRMTIEVTEGDTALWWATLPDFLVEFGGSHDEKIVAPARQERATVNVESAFNPAGLKELRFGGYVRKLSGARHSPEPGQQHHWSARFPVLGNGITSVALKMSLRVTRDVKQPSGKTLNWFWTHGHRLMFTDESFIDFRKYSDNVFYHLPESGYFGHPHAGDHGVEYRTFPARPRDENPRSLQLPAGALECAVEELWGQATGEVIEALGLEPVAGREVWLKSHLTAESAWVPRAIDLSEWNRGGGRYMGNLASTTISLRPGETHVIRVASPDRSSVEARETDPSTRSVDPLNAAGSGTKPVDRYSAGP